jgi:hypothetical protein
MLQQDYVLQNIQWLQAQLIALMREWHHVFMRNTLLLPRPTWHPPAEVWPPCEAGRTVALYDLHALCCVS